MDDCNSHRLIGIFHAVWRITSHYVCEFGEIELAREVNVGVDKNCLAHSTWLILGSQAKPWSLPEGADNTGMLVCVHSVPVYEY